MYGAIGFLAAWLMALAFLPTVHNRAERLIRRHLDDQPLSMKQMQVEKDQIRASFAAATRNLEVSMERLREKTAAHAIDATRKTQLVDRLKHEIETLHAALQDLEAREQAARLELQDLKRELSVKNAALDTAEHEIAAIKAEIARIAPSLLPAASAPPRTSEVVPLAPVRRPLDPTPQPARTLEPVARDESITRAWTEIAETARRIDSYDNAPSQPARPRAGHMPIFKPSR